MGASKLDAMPVPAIILAAGASSRLGQPKQLVQIDGDTLLARTIGVASESGAEPVVVVLGANAERIRDLVDMERAHAVINQDWEQGIASSIHAGIESLLRLNSLTEAVLLLVCDQPRLTAGHLRALIEGHSRAHRGTIVASRYEGVAGVPAIFPASQFPGLLALRGDSGAKSLLRNPACPMVEIEFSGGEIDVDTPFDLAEISKRKITAHSLK
jgi:molybdenum cofactor cytidylyltransferase